MESSKAPQGTYTKIPNVLLDTCDLPDEAMMMFIRLWRQVGHKGGVFYGSIRKLAPAVGVKRDKAHRNLRTLEAVGLVTVDGESIQLSMDELWELNTAYAIGIEVPRWTNLQEVLEPVRKIRQQTDEVSEKSDDLSDKSDTGVANIGQSVRKTGQIVRPSERKVPPKKEEDSNTSNTEEEDSSLSDQQSWYEQVYCKSKMGKRSFKSLKEHLPTLMEAIRTVDDLNSLREFAKEDLRQKNLPDKTVYPGNLVNCLNEWLEEREPQVSDEQESGEPTIQGQPISYWTPERIDEQQPRQQRLIRNLLAQYACTNTT